MRVCLDARLLHASGIGRFLEHLIPFLAEEFDLTLLHDHKDILPYKARLVPMKSSIYSVKEQFELAYKIPDCDLFCSPHFNIPLLPIRAKRRMTTIHDVYHLAFYQELSWAQRCYAKMLYNAALLYSDCVTTVSDFSRQEINKYCMIKKEIHVVHSALAPHFTPTHSEVVKERYALPDQYLLCVGNIKPHKNLYRLVQAYERLDLDIELVCIGKKEGLHTADHQLLEYVAKHLSNRVHFTGYVQDEDLPAIYSMAKLFIFPSLYEGFGCPPLEAMGCHCPVLCSSAASMPEVCQQAVCYVDPYSIDALTHSISALLKNKEQRIELVEKGKKLIEQYTPEKSAKEYITLIYESCNCP